MKKVMVMMAVAALATGAFASKVNWGTAAGYDLGATFAGGSIYLVVGNSGGVAAGEKTSISALTSFTIAAIYGVTGDKYINSNTLGASGAYNQANWIFTNGGATGLSATGAATTYPAIGTTYMYMVAISTDGKTMAYSPLASANLVTSTLTAASYRPTGSWTVITAVPEPTSMALLGLGVAALGLRRKFRK